MRKILLPVLLLFAFRAFSQPADFITVVRKNGRTVKAFFAGVPMAFETYDKRQAAGLVSAIRNDSVFIQQWDIRPALNSIDIPVMDTLGAFISGFHYKEIGRVELPGHEGRVQTLGSRILVIGGAGYILLNLINAAYLHQPVTSTKNLSSLGIAAGAICLGLLWNTLLHRHNRYHVEYIHMQEKKTLRAF